MQGWQDRLRIERQELDDRLRKLERFLSNDKNLESLSHKEAALLISQNYAMRQYLDILDIRLTYVKED